MGRRFWILVFALSVTGCNSLFYYPTRYLYTHPDKLNIAYTEHYFFTPDSTKVHALLLKHKNENPRKGLFVLFHGNAQNLTSHYLQFAWVLNRGYDLFIFDYPGYGASEGEASRPSSIASGKAALEYLSEHLMPVSTEKLVLVGESLGGAILLRTFVEWEDRNRTTLVIAESTFPSYREAARSVLSKNWLTWPIQPFVYFLISEQGSPQPFIDKISPTPLLVVDCKEDAVMEPRLTQKIYQFAIEPKFLWEFSACGHIQAFATQERRDKLITFIDSIGSPGILDNIYIK
jgi:pimeloyl-ACP methyl ester carboxylesterase